MSRGNVFERHHLRGTKSGEVNKAITASGENADKPKMHQGTLETMREGDRVRFRLTRRRHNTIVIPREGITGGLTYEGTVREVSHTSVLLANITSTEPAHWNTGSKSTKRFLIGDLNGVEIMGRAPESTREPDVLDIIAALAAEQDMIETGIHAPVSAVLEPDPEPPGTHDTIPAPPLEDHDPYTQAFAEIRCLFAEADIK